MSEVERFWRENSGLAYITPADTRWPEGFGVYATLRALIPLGIVLDFGCGDGRLTTAFPANEYVGVDINPHAVERCRDIYEDHRFEVAGSVLPEAETALCYAVLLHVPDEAIAVTAERLAAAADRVVVAEVLGRKFRTSGMTPPVFNRDLVDYVEIFAASGMSVHATVTKPYLRYGGVDLTFIDFRKNGGPKSATVTS